MKREIDNRVVHRDWFGLEGFHPGPRFIRDGAVLHLLDTVGSTNAFLRGRGEPARGRLCRWDGWGWQAATETLLEPVLKPRPGTLVVARRQTAGRGRQGRQWLDCGGLNLSVVVPGHRAAFDRGFPVWLGLQTVLVLREEFHLDARLKWPNDIVVGERKLGGILLETAGSGESGVVVAGLGLNLTTRQDAFPAALQGVASSVFLEGAVVPRPGDLAGRILARVEADLDLFGQEGWGPFRPALACLDSLLGRTVELDVGGVRRRGRAVGMDDHGRLLLEEDGLVTAYPVGDVHLSPDSGSEED